MRAEDSRLGRFSWTLGAGGSVQLLSALASLLVLPVLARYLGGERLGVLLTVAALAPLLTLADGALNGATRLFVAENRTDDGLAVRAVTRAGVRTALGIALFDVAALAVVLLTVPLAWLFGHPAGVPADELFWVAAAFAVPVVLSVPGTVHLGALEGVGRTVAASVFLGLGPLLTLPMTIGGTLLGLGLTELAAIQGSSVALPRLLAWTWWRWRPSVVDTGGDYRFRTPTVLNLGVLSLAGLVPLGLDPFIVASYLGPEAAGTYGVATRITGGALLPLVVAAPWLTTRLALARAAGWDDEHRADLVRMTRRAAVGGVAAGALVLLLGPVVAGVLVGGAVPTSRAVYAAGGLFVLLTIAVAPVQRAFSGPTGLRIAMRLSVLLTLTNLATSVVLVRVIGVSGPLWGSAFAAALAYGFWVVLWRRRPGLLAEVHRVGVGEEP